MNDREAVINALRDEAGWVRFEGDVIDQKIAASLERIAEYLEDAL